MLAISEPVLDECKAPQSPGLSSVTPELTQIHLFLIGGEKAHGGRQMSQSLPSVLGKLWYVCAEGNEMLWRQKRQRKHRKGRMVWGNVFLFLTCE